MIVVDKHVLGHTSETTQVVIKKNEKKTKKKSCLTCPDRFVLNEI